MFVWIKPPRELQTWVELLVFKLGQTWFTDWEAGVDDFHVSFSENIVNDFFVFSDHQRAGAVNHERSAWGVGV